MSEFPIAVTGVVPGVLPGVSAPSKRPEVRESWDKNFNPATDATPVVRFGAVFVSPGRYWHAGMGVFMDANAALLDPNSCEECGTDYDENGHVVGPDVRYMVRVRRPEHLFLTKPVYEWTYCGRCLTPVEVETQRQQLLEGMPEAAPQPRRKARRTRAWVP